MFPDIIQPQYIIIPLANGKYRIDSIVFKKNWGSIKEFRNFVAEKDDLIQAQNIVSMLTM